MNLIAPIPRSVARLVSRLVVAAWLIQMGVLVHRSSAEGAAPLAADLARYSKDAQWRGVYYRGEKLGFVVGQTQAGPDGLELREDGQLQMLLLGASSIARIQTVVLVDEHFVLKSFRFSLDPGTGPLTVAGRFQDRRLELSIESRSGKRTEVREFEEAPVLNLSLPRRLAALGLKAGLRLTLNSFDPATLRNAPLTLEVEGREVVWSMGRPVPAFKVRTDFQGLVSNSWVTEVGDVVREESPMGLIVQRETRETALAMGVPGDVLRDLLESSSVPAAGEQLGDALQLDYLRLRLTTPEPLSDEDLQGAGQDRRGDEFAITSGRLREAEALHEDLAPYLAAEPFLESDAPEIVAEARRIAGDVSEPRALAQRLVQHVSRMLEKKPTVSLPSALEVLRTRVGDCNEHTALYVALARALGLPARVAVGLVHMSGAFYYHAWPEVFIRDGPDRGLWLPVDPTLDQFPADPSHLRLARGGLDRQARILPLIGKARITVLEVRRRPGFNPVLIGQDRTDRPPRALPELPRATGGRRSCWSDPEE